ncbi:single-strand DNA-binding protein [Rhodococcus sp. OAS809]|uniref:hypothetical protein n=1 Tax=Rhodococcus sp. OAS809 TaxID=2663874 RepID=UPI00178A60CA
MTQINANNFAKVTGRLTRDPIFFENSNGSKTVKLTLAYSEEFVRSGNAEPQARFVELTAYVPEGSGEGPYAYVVRGSKIAVFYEPYTQVFKRGGKTVYEPTNEIKGVTLEETKAETAARRQRNESEAGAPADQAPTQQAPVEQAPAQQASEDPWSQAPLAQGEYTPFS